MKKHVLIMTGVSLLALAFLFTQCKNTSSTGSEDDGTSMPLMKITNPNHPNVEVEPAIRFPDFGAMVDPGKYDGRVFLLSQDFPEKKPAVDSGVEKIFSIDFKTNWEEYALAVRDYVLEGNGKPNDVANSFYLEENKVRPWYHVPWQHWGSTGREGIHGLTREGPIAEKMLAQSQTETSYAYAVGFYNDLGGYHIGQVWPEVGPPVFDKLLAGNNFPVGTVVGKVLWTTLDGAQVPYLNNPITWDAYVYGKDVPGSGVPDSVDTRMIAPVNLIQMDIMVRDERAASTGGWVFGTFVYNGNLNSEDPWKNLQPVGLMWGNDPEERESSNNPTPTETIINPALTETMINTDESMPAMHLGWGSRLNGPVDNPNSSCMSCHSTAQYPGVSAIMPFLNNPKIDIPPVGTIANDAWMEWFRNVPCGTAFNQGQAISFDYSLQLQKSVENYIEYLNTTKDGLYYLQYWDSPYKAARNAVVSSN